MNAGCSCIRLVQKQIRNFSTSSICTKSKSSHYDSLGITPKATQADVKTAYYELSKVYHPDRNKGCDEAARKFRDISEAYEVLGNVKTRKLYDKGMSIGTSFGSQAQSRDRTSPFYENREQRTRPSASGGRQPIYDFDEWSRAHYGATFARDMARKQRKRTEKERELELKRSDKVERVLMYMALFLAVCTCILSSWGDDYDSVTVVGNTTVLVPRDDRKDH